MCGEGGTLQQILLACWGVLAVGEPHWVCHGQGPYLPGHTAQALGALQGHCHKGGSAFCALPTSKPLKFLGAPTEAQTQMGCGFCVPSRSSCSGNWVLGELTVPGESYIFCTSQFWPCLFPRCTICLLWELISGCDTSSRCEPSRTLGRRGCSWQPAHTLVEDGDVVFGAKIAAAPWHPALSNTHLPLCLWGEGPKYCLACSPLAFTRAQSFAQ